MKHSPTQKLSNSIKIGDVLYLGDHVLICGDARTAPIGVGRILNNPIDLILTDPPYAVDYVESKRGLCRVSVDKDILNDGKMTEHEYKEFTQAWLGHAMSFLAVKNSIYVFNSDKMFCALHDTFEDLGLHIAQLLIWLKDRPVMGRLDYQPQHELILYGWYGTHLFRHAKGRSVIHLTPKPAKNALHPTMKPVSLLRRFILNSSDIGSVVYDPFGGSGSTLIACEHTKRKCVMVEIDPAYCETIVLRWMKLTGYGENDIRHERSAA